MYDNNEAVLHKRRRNLVFKMFSESNPRKDLNIDAANRLWARNNILNQNIVPA